MSDFPSPEQRAVIDYRLAPLRVAAGAGSGKTGTMAARLAHLVAAGVVEPEAALGITFTNKAAFELAERLREQLPDITGDGREVEVTTYHGFAHSLLSEFGPYVGIPRDVRVATPGYTRQLIRDAIAATPRRELDLTQPGRVVDAVARLAGALGDHLAGPNDLFDGDDPDDPVRAERAALAAVLERYDGLKRRYGVVDFADLVAEAHRLVTDFPDVAARIRERYAIVLLDEYQDTNAGQRELLRALFGEGFPVTAVGDTDQTIYEWRGATPRNFEDFCTQFPESDGTPAMSMNLSVSWRNDAAIVDGANAVRRQLTAHSPIDELRPRSEAGQGRVTTHWAHSAEGEARWIADRVQQLHEEGTPWREIAVLFRKHRQMAAVRDALSERDIPVEVASLGGLLEVPEVVELHAWLRLLGRPDDAVALARILTGSRYRLGLGDLVPLVQWLRHRDGDDGGIGWNLLEAVDELSEEIALPEETRRRLEAFRRVYRSLLMAAQGLSLVDLCRLVLATTGTWPEVEALGDAARLSARLNLYRFLDLAEEWDPLGGRPSLAAFLDHLDLLADEAAATELDTARVSGEDAVPLLTVHRAKGLEWDCVFLPGLAEGVFPSRVIRLEDPDAVPWVLPHSLRLDGDTLDPLPDDPEERRAELRRAHADQEWRAAYVAVTRARHALFASGAFWTGGKKPRAPGPLFAVLDSLAEQAPDRCHEPGDPPEPGRRTESPAPDPVFPEGWGAALGAAADDPDVSRRLAADLDLLEPYDRHVEQLHLELKALPVPADHAPEDEGVATSVTGLVTLATCPLRFRWSEVDRLPRRPNPAARRGVEIHRQIELHNRGSMAFDEASPDFYDAVGYSDEGPAGALAVFRSSRFAAERPHLVEAPFTLVRPPGRVSGRIDAVYGRGSGFEVVDFKSGTVSDDPARRVQLEAYALALVEADLVPATSAELTVTFAYLGGGHVEEVTEEVTPEWLERAAADVDALLEGAGGDEFPATPSPACRHCDFVGVCGAGRAWIEANS